MSDTNNLSELPVDPISNGNTTITVKDIMETQLPQSNQQLDQNIINQIVSGLQQASQSGATLLPSRDIPLNTQNHSIDPYTVPNYIPPVNKSQMNYIPNNVSTNEMINNYNLKRASQDTLDELYNEMQLPVLLSVIYFLFQLPFMKKISYTYMPFLFSNDGNYNLSGFLFTSISFAFTVYLFIKTTSYFSVL